MPPETEPAIGSRRRALLEAAGAIGATILFAFVLLRLWRVNLHVPMQYRGDAGAFAMIVKSVIDGGWYWTNSYLGAPGVFTMYDFPVAESFHLFLIKVMSWVISDWALVFNLYYLMGFPLITLSALAVFRHFRISYAPALACSLLYAFLPSHLIKGQAHYFLDIFYEVPLAILVALWLGQPNPPLARDPGRKWWPGLELRRPRSLAALGICLLTAGTGIYYAFFAGLFMMVAGLWASIERRRAANALAAAMLTGVLVAGLGVQAVPSVLYHRRHGPNPAVANRQPIEAEIFALKITELLLPAPQHRYGRLRGLKDTYDHYAPFPGEVASTSLGLVASAGFLALLVMALFRWRPRGFAEEPLGRIAGLNGFAVLFATFGGFGSLFALLVTPEIRTYSRMHVFIAFLSLFAVAAFMEWVRRKHGRLGAFLPVAVLGIGLVDQVTPAALRKYDENTRKYTLDGQLVQKMESVLPPGSMVFELPYMRFPESGAVLYVMDYDPVRFYFHTRALRWSYPTMAGRPEDAWVKTTSELPPPEMIAAIRRAGFRGLLIDILGYKESAVVLKDGVTKVLGRPPMISPDRQMLFWPL
jgi:phosphoglycerol transferase